MVAQYAPDYSADNGRLRKHVLHACKAQPNQQGFAQVVQFANVLSCNSIRFFSFYPPGV
jgi:hypothetical protein